MIEIEIGKCCTIVNGSTPSRTKPEYWGGKIDWFTPKDLSKIEGKYVFDAPEKITIAGYNSCSTTKVPAGSLLFTSRAPIGHLAITQKEACTNQGFKTLVPNENVNVEFLYYVIKKLTPQLKYLGNGATFKELSKATVSKFKIPLPPLEDQKKIAAILDAADAYRQKTKALIAKYDELTQSLFLDMFGDPVTNPMGWEKKILSEIATISSGITKGRKHKEENFIGDLPYMRVANVQDGFLELSEVKTIPAYNSDLDKFLLKQGDVLMTEGGDPDKLGRGAVWNGEVENCLHQNHIFKVRVNRQLLTPLYFSMLAGSPYGKRYFLKVAKQTTGIATINKTQLSKFPVLMASKKLQIDFTERVKAIESQKANAQVSLQKAEDLFNSLLQRAFKGELTK